jgi:uncharacterized protein (TIGR02117 family)
MPIMQVGSHLAGANAKRVYVVHNNWHAALVVPKADLIHGLVPEQEHFPEAEYLEIGWGDRDYFPATQESVGLALRAAFWSRGSVLHVVGFKGTVTDYVTDGEIIEIILSREAFLNLSAFVSASFSRADPSVPGSSQPGLVATGRFYPAIGRFSILRTCNTWIASTSSPPPAWLGRSGRGAWLIRIASAQKCSFPCAGLKPRTRSCSDLGTSMRLG